MRRCRPAIVVAVACVCSLALAAAASAGVPPAAPVPVSPANTSVIAETQPVLEYLADPATTVIFEVDGVDSAPLVPFADGTVDYFPQTPLARGLHTVRARAIDATGLGGQWSPTTGFWVGGAVSADPGTPDDAADGSDDSDDSDDAPDPSTPAITTATTPTPPPASTPAVHAPLHPAVAISKVRLRGAVLQSCPAHGHHCLEKMAALSLSVSRAATVSLTLAREDATSPSATVTLTAWHAGTVAYVLRRRVGGHPLAPGAYKLTIQATAKLGGAQSSAVTERMAVR
jgi:hypothetical protein